MSACEGMARTSGLAQLTQHVFVHLQEQRLLDDLVAEGQEHLTEGWSDAGLPAMRMLHHEALQH